MRPEKICLASRSPRRAELLRQLGVRFEVLPADIRETPRAGESVARYVLRMAVAKTDAVLSRQAREPRWPILAADTVVELDGRILGKPGGRDEALGMLATLSSREHRVFSGVALWCAGAVHTAMSTSRVRFRAITPAEAAAYWETGEPADKAGGYAIQGRGAVFVQRLAGSYSGVMGLPLFETAGLLGAAGIEILKRGRGERVR